MKSRPVRPQVKVIVCGSASFDDRAKVRNALDRLHARREITLLIHGANPGPDVHAAEWAKDRGVEVRAFPSVNKRDRHADDTDKHYSMMQLGPDGLVAFPGDFFSADLVRYAEGRGVRPWYPYGP